MSDTSSALARFSRLRVVFGHQSVGEDILEGLRTLAARDGVSLMLSSVEEAPRPGLGAVIHARVGRNTEPLTKLDAFGVLVDAAAERGPVDVALLKFCYIDIDEQTEVDALFEAYRTTLERVAARHPSTRVIPVTAPLRHSPGGFGVWVRERLGRPNRSKLANLARQRFNTRVREHWAGRPLYDLAAAEAAGPDGRAETIKIGNTLIQHMRQAYTHDGGHLNNDGRRVAAQALVTALTR